MKTFITPEQAIELVTSALPEVKGEVAFYCNEEVIFTQDLESGKRKDALDLTRKINDILSSCSLHPYTFSTIIYKTGSPSGVRQIQSTIRLNTKEVALLGVEQAPYEYATAMTPEQKKATKYEYAPDMTPEQKKAFRRTQRKLAKKAQA